MNIGIIGLGLIGGSLAKAYKRAGFTVYGMDKDKLIIDFAKMAGAVDEEATEEKIKICDVIFLAIQPEQAVKWMNDNKNILTEKNIVIDCCGTKRVVCEAGFKISKENGFKYAGGHPMAGYHKGGFKYSREDLFDNALFVLVPYDHNDINMIKYITDIIMRAGFGKVTCTSKEEHDSIIAFTSQMPHIVSNAFVKSETALNSGTKVSAGSYRDFTRVAYLDPDMWAELFMENKDNLKKEIDILCGELLKYSKALEHNDKEELRNLLAEGRDRKTEVDEKWNWKI